MGQPRHLFVYIRSFQKINTFLQQINVKNVSPSSIQRRDSNPLPLEHESSPITTRPGLLPSLLNCLPARTYVENKSR